MARQTLPRGDLLSLVGAGAAARTPQAEPEPQTESAPIRREEPTDATRPKRVAKRAIAPKGKGAPAPENETPSAPALSQPARKEKFNCRLTPDLADAVRGLIHGVRLFTQGRSCQHGHDCAGGSGKDRRGMGWRLQHGGFYGGRVPVVRAIRHGRRCLPGSRLRPTPAAARDP